MQEDTYRGDGLNLYVYCANNPVIYYEPSGHGKKSQTLCGTGSNSDLDDTVGNNANQPKYEVSESRRDHILERIER